MGGYGIIVDIWSGAPKVLDPVVQKACGEGLPQ